LTARLDRLHVQAWLHFVGQSDWLDDSLLNRVMGRMRPLMECEEFFGEGSIGSVCCHTLKTALMHNNEQQKSRKAAFLLLATYSDNSVRRRLPA
jgi:hypothetical protein